MKEALKKLSSILCKVKLSSPSAGLKNLAKVPHGIWHQVESLDGPEEACHRLLDLGFTPGAEVKVAQAAPLGEPLVVVLRGTRLALRKDEAAWIIVV